MPAHPFFRLGSALAAVGLIGGIAVGAALYSRDEGSSLASSSATWDESRAPRRLELPDHVRPLATEPAITSCPSGRHSAVVQYQQPARGGVIAEPTEDNRQILELPPIDADAPFEDRLSLIELPKPTDELEEPLPQLPQQ